MSRFNIKSFLYLFADAHRLLSGDSALYPALTPASTLLETVTAIQDNASVDYKSSGGEVGGFGSYYDELSVSGNTAEYSWSIYAKIDTQNGCTVSIKTKRTVQANGTERLDFVFSTDRGVIARNGVHTLAQMQVMIAIANSAVSAGLFDAVEEAEYLRLRHKPYVPFTV